MSRKKHKLKKKPIIIFILLLLIIGTATYYFTDFSSSKNNTIEKENNQEEPNQENSDKEKEDVIEETTLTLTAVGDALIHSAVYYDARTSNGSYDFKPMFSNVKSLFQSYDLAFYNQETVLGGTQLGLSSYPRFNSPYEVGDAFMDMGFNLVNLATNHTLDRGRSAISNQLAYWGKQEGVITAGSYVSEEMRQNPIILEKNNITYTLLGYTTVNNGLSISSDYGYMYNYYNATQVKEDIERVRDKVDLLIVSMHWGEEYTHTPTESQKQIAEYLASLGVDIIIGTHPHVLQPIDFIGDTMVIYSLGNFISAQTPENDNARLIGLKADVTVKKTTVNGVSTVSLENPKAELIYNYSKRWTSNGTTYRSGFKLYRFNQLNDNILPNYKRYYEKYMKIATSYNDKIEAVGLE